MFARIIPSVRTPIGVDVFDYQIPDGLDIQIGDAVRIPFRRREIIGLVRDITEQSAYAKRISLIKDSYDELHFPSSMVDLLAWTAERSFSSQPTVLKSWWRELPKRSPHRPIKNRTSDQNRGKGEINATWQDGSFKATIDRAKALQATGVRSLILFPWIESARRAHHELPSSLLYVSDISHGQAFLAWRTFMETPGSCLISTRLGAWLSPIADYVLLAEPEQDDYKQDELSPRYDARRMCTWSALHAGTHLEGYGLTPPLTNRAIAPTIKTDVRVFIRHPEGRSDIPYIQSDALQAFLEHPGEKTIIHPIRGTQARYVCRDCGWRATCDSCGYDISGSDGEAACRLCGKKTHPPLACPTCAGVDLGKALPGIERLQHAWSTHFPTTPVNWRTVSNVDLTHPFPTKSCTLLTDAMLIGGGLEDVRRRERQYTAFRRLADQIGSVDGTLLLQSAEIDALLWTEWLDGNGLEITREKERQERKLFRYPPAVRLVKALIQGTEADLANWMTEAGSIIPPDSIRGPFPVAYRTKRQTPRWSIHLLFPADTEESTLVCLLRPLAENAILDIDPVQFFR